MFLRQVGIKLLHLLQELELVPSTSSMERFFNTK